ncbi:5'-3' exonuclease [Mesoplasma photuris]|uniref:5'-3' exonuclease n=1 Tax=Mesoplasma photuris TaxID=217731 RepID=UPI0004E0CE0A|nr:5'-3' exonuclease [Mesoplasma photuris]
MTTKNEKQTILIIDGYHLLHKGYYGSLKRKTVAENRDGVMINAIYTFVAKINEFIDMNIYHTIIVTFDVDKGCWRRELYPEYKAKRKETPEELIPQMQIIREFLTAANIPWYEHARYEGDDVMGTIARIANKLDYNVHILSNDKDTFQLVSENTKIIVNVSKKEKPVFIKDEEVFEKFGCGPSQVADIKALMGDSSDNIKGIKCLHYKQAIELLNKYEHVENIFDHIDELQPALAKKIICAREQILLNKKITTIQSDLKLGRVDFRKLRVNWYGYLKFLKKQKMWAFTGNVVKKIEAIQAGESRFKDCKSADKALDKMCTKKMTSED